VIRPGRATALLVALAALGALTGCRGDAASPAKAGTCLGAPAAQPTSASPPTSPGAATSPTPSGNVASPQLAFTGLPALSLACYDGSGKVKLSTLGRPAVINLWASWCPPCRAELPGIQAFAATGVVTVIGVDTADTRSGAASTIQDHGLTYPMLSDPDKALSNAIGRSVLPVTLFVDAQNRVRYVYASGTPLTKESLTQLVAEHLGVGG
jgi:thiol-disulfide isomerase/thioredoxin